MHRFNAGVHIPTVLERVGCGRHSVPVGIPCFHVDFDTREGSGSGVCGFRIAKAGFNGDISPFSLRLKVPGGRADSRAKR